MNKRIINKRVDILCKFNQTQYLLITKERNFENVRNTKLWDLWYGDNISLLKMEELYTLAKNEVIIKESFYELVETLYIEFETIFDELRKKGGEYYGIN